MGEKSRPNERVAIVYPWANLDTCPSVCAAIEVLAEHGYSVDVFMPSDNAFQLPKFNGSHVRLTTLPTSRLRLGFRRLIHSWYLDPVRVVLRPLKRLVLESLSRNPTQPWMEHLCRHHKETPYKCVIGIDPQGLEVAGHLSEAFNVPLVYWSLELWLSNELTTKQQKALKKKELDLSHKASFVVIQDEDRARLLAQENNIAVSKFVFVPNAPRGYARRQPSGYWHHRLGIDTTQRIVLHAGGIEDWTGISEIISSAKDWPDGWVLVVHTRYRCDTSRYLKRLRTIADPHKVLFSMEPVTRQEYPTLVNGADIGIAFYRPSPSENIHVIGLSSGKIAYYLQAGLPIIVNRWPSVSSLVEKEGCGIVVNQSDEIGGAITEIARDYNKYGENACRTFSDYLEPTCALQRFVTYIGSL